MHEINNGVLYVEFGIEGTDKASKTYRVSSLTLDGTNQYSFRLDKSLGDDVNFITDDVSGFNSTKIKENVTLSIYNYVQESNSSFEGRFYVKIAIDSIFTSKIKATTEDNKRYDVVNSKKLYFMRSDFAENTTPGEGHYNAMTGLDGDGGIGGNYKTYDNANAVYNHSGLDYINYQMENSATNQWAWSGGANFTTLSSLAASHKDFSKFAVFFRNYKYADNSETLEINDGLGTMMNVGRWKFGSTPGDWKNEFLSYTSIGEITNPSGQPYGGFVGGWSNTGVPDVNGTYSDQPTPTQVADERQREDEVMFIDQGPFLTRRGSNNSIHWSYMAALGLNSTKTAFNITAKIRSYKQGIVEGSTSWTMDIGQGPIFKPGLNNTNSNFFGNNNPEYQDENDKDLVAKQNPGSQFRFREDPTETVYAMIPSTGYNRTVRYAANYNYGGVNTLNQREIPQLSVNFTNNRTVKCTPAIAWNPVEDHNLGPISSGYNFSVNTKSSGTVHSNSTGGNIDEHFIILENNTGVDPVYGTVHVVPGLIVTKHGSTSVNKYLIVKDVVESGGYYRVYLCGYSRMLREDDCITPNAGDAIVFQQPTMNGYSENSVNRFNTNSDIFSIEKPGIRAVGYTMEFLDEARGEQSMPDNPAIFETEPKTSGNGDIYYEASGAKACVLDENTIETVLPLGSIITSDLNDPGIYNAQLGADSYIPENTSISEYTGGRGVRLSGDVPVEDENYLVFPNVTVAGVAVGKNYKIISPGGVVSYVTIESIEQDATESANNTTRNITFEASIINKTHFLNWHNCYSFGNGVESNRIKDLFNKPFISNGAKVSSTLQEEFGEEHRKYGLIFSGIYNSNSSTNNLNQFIQAENITKDLNPIYGSIQKLHTRDSDLIVLCEDKVLKVLANKDAIFNADGNTQLTSNQNVLGQTVPFAGEYGISTNPESFASEAYRIYFSDKVRGSVMRLSKDGLTPISAAGMKDYFKDSLKLSTKIIGSHDDKKDEYNITLADRKVIGEELIANGDFNVDAPASINIPYVLGQWFMSSGPNWFWDSVNKNMYSNSHQHSRVGQYLPPVSLGKTYEISWTVGEVLDTPLQGYLWVTLHDDRNDAVTLRSNYKTISKRRTKVGIQTVTVTVDDSWNPWIYADSIDGAMASGLYFHNKEHTTGDGLFFNGTIDNVSVRELISEPVTVSFREDVRGWSSFKSFILENGISCASNYYTVKHGKLWKHHVEDSYKNRNTFYDKFTNSSVTVLLNQEPGTIKSFNTLHYEGSQSRVEGVKTVTVGVDSLTGVNPNGELQGFYFYFNTKSEMDDFLGYAWDSGVVSTNIKQYRGGTLIREGFIYLANIPTTFGFVGRWNQGSTVSDSNAAAAGDWEVGDIITTQIQENSVSHFNTTPKDGWHASSIETDKQQGSLNEFIEKEGKWFNYIKGIEDMPLDLAAFNVQGVGVLKSIATNVLGFSNKINQSIQVGDTIYYQQTHGFNSSEIIKYGVASEVSINHVTVVAPVSADPVEGAFVFFEKNNIANISSILGYYASVKFENNSKNKAEIFSISSEVNESSK